VANCNKWEDQTHKCVLVSEIGSCIRDFYTWGKRDSVWKANVEVFGELGITVTVQDLQAQKNPVDSYRRTYEKHNGFYSHRSKERWFFYDAMTSIKNKKWRHDMAEKYRHNRATSVRTTGRTQSPRNTQREAACGHAAPRDDQIDDCDPATNDLGWEPAVSEPRFREHATRQQRLDEEADTACAGALEGLKCM